MKIDISGKVVKRRFRLPKVSMVYMAGIANSQLMSPKPSDADRADIGLNPPSRKI